MTIYRGVNELAGAILTEIAESGVDGVRMHSVADRLEVAIGTLYSRWGGKVVCLERTWRYVVGHVDEGIEAKRSDLDRTSNGVDEIWDAMNYGVPEQVDAFLE